MTTKDHLGILPLVHAAFLLDHQVPNVLSIGPAQLWQGGNTPLSFVGWLSDETAETENKKNC